MTVVLVIDQAIWFTPFCYIVLAFKLLSSDRWHIFRYGSKVLLNRILIDLQCTDLYPGSCGNFYAEYSEWHIIWRIILCTFHFGHCKLHYWSITLNVRAAIQSLYLFMVDAKPYSAKPNVNYNCFNCSFQIFPFCRLCLSFSFIINFINNFVYYTQDNIW